LWARIVFLSLAALSGNIWSRSEQGANEAVISGINAAVQRRETSLLSYTVTEHYTVFRNHDEQHPAADMMVKTTYRRDAGKNFTVVSLTGSLLLRKMLEEVLATEKKMTLPANRATALITPSNYEMAVKGPAVLDGRNCILVEIKPRRESPYLFSGLIWVDAQSQAIVQLQGLASKSPSVVTGPTQIFRQYVIIDEFAMARHAQAVSNSSLLGQTMINIDYSGYDIQPGGK